MPRPADRHPRDEGTEAADLFAGSTLIFVLLFLSATVIVLTLLPIVNPNLAPAKLEPKPEPAVAMVSPVPKPAPVVKPKLKAKTAPKPKVVKTEAPKPAPKKIPDFAPMPKRFVPKPAPEVPLVRIPVPSAPKQESKPYPSRLDKPVHKVDFSMITHLDDTRHLRVHDWIEWEDLYKRVQVKGPDYSYVGTVTNGDWTITGSKGKLVLEHRLGAELKLNHVGEFHKIRTFNCEADNGCPETWRDVYNLICAAIDC